MEEYDSDDSEFWDDDPPKPKRRKSNSARKLDMDDGLNEDSNKEEDRIVPGCKEGKDVIRTEDFQIYDQENNNVSFKSVCDKKYDSEDGCLLLNDRRTSQDMSPYSSLTGGKCSSTLQGLTQQDSLGSIERSRTHYAGESGKQDFEQRVVEGSTEVPLEMGMTPGNHCCAIDSPCSEFLRTSSFVHRTHFKSSPTKDMDYGSWNGNNVQRHASTGWGVENRKDSTCTREHDPSVLPLSPESLPSPGGGGEESEGETKSPNLLAGKGSHGVSPSEDRWWRVPPKKRWLPGTEDYHGQVLVTDVTHNALTVTFYESTTEKGFFKEYMDK